MKQNNLLSAEEGEAIRLLGGIDRVAAIADRVLTQHGFQRSLFTSSERRRIRRECRAKELGMEFHFDTRKSLRANIEDLLTQAAEIQAAGGGTHYVGAMLQHLVGAKLDLVLGPEKLQHHRFSVADAPTARSGDYQVEAVAIHVTTHPTEDLARKCGENLKAGLKPLIITLGEAVGPAGFILDTFDLKDRVDVLDATQFLTANVYERSLFKAAQCKVTLAALLERYNAIVETCETDPSLRIKLPG
jgi:hypothetical protein